MMSRNYYSEINLHLTWHCKESAPMLTAQIEPVAHRLIKQRIIRTPEVILQAIGGTDTHIHVAITIPPTLTVSEFVGQIKGGSSHDVNEQFELGGKVLQWQIGYGVVSFGTKDLPWVKQYIHNQREHHGAQRVLTGWNESRRSRIAAAGDGREPGKPGWQRRSDGERPV